jgi:hypothetical protein
MDDQIAPVDDAPDAPDAAPENSDLIADYRRHLYENTGDRVGARAAARPAAPAGGAGPMIAPGPSAQPQGAGPAVEAPSAPDAPMIAPVGQAPQAPNAPQAAQAPQARQAAMARGAPQATQAPTIDGAPTNPVPAGLPFGPGAPPLSMGGATSPSSGAQPDPTNKPAAAHVIKGKKTEDGKPLVNIQPPDHDADTDFDKKKLADVHTPADLVDALKPGARTRYMDWWEQQHGDINARYDQMRAELGARPDPNREPTRQEKFTELMNFGLQLMQNARRGADPVAAAGQSVQQAFGAQKAKQQAQTEDYDTKVAGIEGQRQTQLKDLGNYGQAVREDSLIKNQDVQTANAYASMLKPPKTGQPITRVTPDGTQLQYNQDSGAWDVSLTSDGKPVKLDPNTGPRGGQKGAPARMQEFNQLINEQHMDPNRALAAVYGTGGYKPDDPQKTYNSIYLAAKRQYEPEEDAKAEAERMTAVVHGDNWRGKMASRNAPPIKGKPPAPPSVAPPPNKIGVFNGWKWRRGADGKPEAVGPANG